MICTGIQSQIQELQDKIDTIYSDLDGGNVYKLHSVLVHDGRAGIGHYWTFIKDPIGDRWLKFNDTTVTEVH